MSTKQRYGSLVWNTIVNLQAGAGHEWNEWLTAGDIAAEAGISIPTARKYLNLLVEMEKLHLVHHKKTRLYAIVFGKDPE